MLRVKQVLIIALTAILAGCVLVFISQEETADADVGTHQLEVGDTIRNYRIVIPHKLVRPSPVVFAFHGIGDTADSMAEYTRLDRLAALNGFLLVYPTARNSMWATIDIESSNLNENGDVRFFDQLLSHITTAYDVDRNRVYLMGMSNGASFAQLLAVARSNDIAALVAHSGARPEILVEPDKPVPVMLIAGEEDAISSIMQSDAEQYRTHGAAVCYVSVPNLAHEWSTRHNNEMWQFLSRYPTP